MSDSRRYNVKRITVSLPPETLEQLDLVSKGLGLSRSAFLSSFLGQSLPALCALASNVVEAEKTGDSRRYRGEVISEANKLITAMQDELAKLGGQDDLFKD